MEAMTGVDKAKINKNGIHFRVSKYIIEQINNEVQVDEQGHAPASP